MNKIPWLNDLASYLNFYHKSTLTANETVADYNVELYIKNRLCPSFTEELFNFITEKELEDPDVYKDAGLDRRLFSKIRSDSTYQPSKRTVFALCLSLKLNYEESERLLRSAGYGFSNSHTLDLIVRFSIEHQIYNRFEVNFALDHYGLDPL